MSQLTDAYFSADRKYRYWLLRVWDESKPLVAYISKNPSTADERDNDPTVRKGIGFGLRWGYGGGLWLNVGAFRATDPRKFANSAEPIGTENTVEYLHQYLSKFQPEKVVAAWGNMHPRFKARCATIRSQIPNLWCFGFTFSGEPKHPLMLAYDTPLQRFVNGKYLL
jgi:hypothetical protein